MKKRVLILATLVFVIAPLFSQVVPGINARLFRIVTSKKDTIDFLKMDSCVAEKKPVILFCQGSLPYPLVIDFDGKNSITNISNFDYKKLSRKYHIVMISMPHTPPIASYKHLNRQYAYVPDTANEYGFDKLYLKDNYLDRYVERAERVLAYLKKQPWVDSRHISVFGHSQGSYIAIKLAMRHPELQAVGYSGGNPSGRFSLFVRQIRRDVIAKKITGKEAQNQIDSLYLVWKAMKKGQLILGFQNGDPAYTWTSFSVSLREELTKLKLPIFIAYGTKDLESTEGSELMPIYFEQAGKTNYKMLPMVDCGHNFEEYKADGTPDYDKMHWDDVMQEFIKWIEGL